MSSCCTLVKVLISLFGFVLFAFCCCCVLFALSPVHASSDMDIPYVSYTWFSKPTYVTIFFSNPHVKCSLDLTMETARWVVIFLKQYLVRYACSNIFSVWQPMKRNTDFIPVKSFLSFFVRFSRLTCPEIFQLHQILFFLGKQVLCPTFCSIYYTRLGLFIGQRLVPRCRVFRLEFIFLIAHMIKSAMSDFSYTGCSYICVTFGCKP